MFPAGTRVFVSSTFVDLQDHRAAVRENLRVMDLSPVGMEDFGSRPMEPLEAALGVVETCAVFVGIYAHRYGTVPIGETRSVTEQELDHALALGLPAYLYIVDESHRWPDSKREPSATSQLKALNAKASRLTRSTLDSVDIHHSRRPSEESIGRSLKAVAGPTGLPEAHPHRVRGAL
jgi:hypothetical protein